MKAITSVATVMLLLAGVGLVACGGDDDGDTEVSMTEYAFEPKDLTVSEGDTITAKNDGQIDHNYSIKHGPAKTPTSKVEIGASTDKYVNPGATGELPVDFVGGRDPKRYNVICTIPGHAEKGMTGTLTVE
jgi:uncharacterized cupredoxin-like copper-binding protein